MPNEQPGQYPFTRGIYPEMYRKRLWTMRQYAGFASAEDSNRRYHYLLSKGQTGLSVAFDLPTQIGYDSDHSLAEGEVGRVGVPISSLADMEILFSEINLEQVSVSMTINATAPIILAFYLALAEKQGFSWSKLRGTIQNDILKEYIARGTYIYPVQPSLKLVTDIMAFCSTNLPKWNTISISGYHIREAGATAAQELAFTFANAIAYVQAALETGLDIDQFGPRLSFFWNAHNNFFEEIAKFRAARRIWARIMKERFGATNPKAMQCRFHVQTAGSTLTAQEIDNNVVRVTLQALAAILGGTQSLHTNAKDEALGLPTDESATLALRTQQIIAYESGIPNYVDPLGGSEVVEKLTDRLEKEVFGILEAIEKLGGVIAAIEAGWIQREIGQSAYEYQQQVERGEKIVVGVNKFASDVTVVPEPLRIDPKATERQLKRLAEVRQKRDGDRTRLALRKLQEAAERDENLMPHLIEAAKTYATLGEMADVLRQVYGEYRPVNG